MSEAFPPSIKDWRQTGHNPLSALESRRLQPLFLRQTQVLIDVPLSRGFGLTLNSFPLTRESSHPFVRALRIHVSGGSKVEVIHELEKYYASWTPKTAAEVYGFDKEAAPEWSKQETDAKPLMLPWEKRRLESFKKIARQGFGPLDYGEVERKYGQLTNLCDSLGNYGYDRENRKKADPGFEDIEGVILKNSTNWRVMISKGQNRVAVAVALGYESVPACIRRVIDRSTADEWPGVRDGFFTLGQALFVFDRLFCMEQPQAWTDS